jgi:hypothetical protein
MLAFSRIAMCVAYQVFYLNTRKNRLEQESLCTRNRHRLAPSGRYPGSLPIARRPVQKVLGSSHLSLWPILIIIIAVAVLPQDYRHQPLKFDFCPTQIFPSVRVWIPPITSQMFASGNAGKSSKYRKFLSEFHSTAISNRYVAAFAQRQVRSNF